MPRLSRSAVILILAGLGLPGCKRTVHYAQVPLSGLPRCPPGVMLLHPVMVELTAGHGGIGAYFTGTPGEAQSMSVPEGRQQWLARFGLCHNRADPHRVSYRCGVVDWYAKKRIVLDPSKPGSRIAVPPPPQHACATPSVHPKTG